ncbi:hypothetical protein [Actinomadura gamaensis]|uniref:Uncharacterized protein n=1 Tax=Actinomadura gamaensis TaxID=1763541 RepID=A0ABV9TTC1_9ACTN
MVRKKVEGNEQQRRAAAREAHRAGEAPSARKQTTGASKQRSHLTGRNSLTHEEKVTSPHRGKQQWEAGQADGTRPAAPEETRTFHGRGRPGYSERHERVFQAVADAEAEHDGQGVDLDETARRVGLPKDETRTLLHDLMTVHGLVTELAGADDPDLGPRYEVKPRM